MEFQTIVTLKQTRYAAVLAILRLYMEHDECVCEVQPSLFADLMDRACPPDCEACMWCQGRKALRGVGVSVE